jgi:hypothetical protein
LNHDSAEKTRDFFNSLLALSLLSKQQNEEANIAFQNSENAIRDGETRNRLLFEAIMKSVLKVRDGTK